MPVWDLGRGGGFQPPASQAPASGQADFYELAYIELNERLFGFDLPPCLIYVKHIESHWGGLYIQSQPPRIELSATMVASADMLTILGVLVHEMLHHWQHCRGSETQGLHHNQEFLDRLQALGFTPHYESDNFVSQSIEPRGRYALAFKQLRLA